LEKAKIKTRLKRELSSRRKYKTTYKDIKYYFNIEIESHEKLNKNQYTLSKKAYTNLKKHLRKDYECIDKLYEFGVLSNHQYKLLSK